MLVRNSRMEVISTRIQAGVQVALGTMGAYDDGNDDTPGLADPCGESGVGGVSEDVKSYRKGARSIETSGSSSSSNGAVGGFCSIATPSVSSSGMSVT